jgi:hypothetical protein
MNVREAIVLMVNNPDVGFPWEGTLVRLINGFLPPESQLDPQTAEPLQIQQAIDTLDAATKEMVFSSEIAAGGGSRIPPAPAAPVVAIDPQALEHMSAAITKVAVFMFAVIVLYIVARVGDTSQIVEILKLVISAFLPNVPGT